MTVDEMITFLKADIMYAKMDVPHNVPKYEAIIAALRAGQNIRDCLDHALTLEYLGGGSTEGWAKEVTQAWDAALKGDK